MITHVFVTQASLQDHLIRAVIRQLDLSDGAAVIISLRRPTSLQVGGAVAHVIDGDVYNLANGLHFIKYRPANTRKIGLFKKEVLALLSVGYSVYAAMYSRWYLRLLAEKAGSVNILEDGLGSYMRFEDITEVIMAELSGNKWTAKHLRHLVSVPRRYRFDRKGMLKLLTTADNYYVTSARAFPDIDDARKHVFVDAFPAEASGVYDGRVILATSCMVEAGLTTLSDYLNVLRVVLQKMIARGYTDILVKWHPNQIRHAVNYAEYVSVLNSFNDQFTWSEFPAAQSVETAARGSDLVLVSGISSLLLYVSEAGRPAYHYIDLLVGCCASMREKHTISSIAVLRSVSKAI